MNNPSRARASLALIVVFVAGIAAGAAFYPVTLRRHDAGRSGAPPPQGDSSGTESAVTLYTCGMHPQVRQKEPGLCPICHMELTPVAAEGGSGGTVVIDPVVVQNMGVRLARVVTGSLERELTAAGYLVAAEPRLRDVTLRVSGWIETLHADTEGMHLSAGDPLFELYSPELEAAIGELRAAQSAANGLPRESASEPASMGANLSGAVRRKLEQWGLAREQIDRLATGAEIPRAITFSSPISGVVVKKLVVAGSRAMAGDLLFRLADYSSLWVDAQVPEAQLPFVAVGQSAIAAVEGVHGEPVVGAVTFIHPELDPVTRTARVRLVVANPAGVLRPGMFARVTLRSRLAESAVLVPRSAVIDTGERQIAFVALGAGRFEPRSVTLGHSATDGAVQVLAGLAPGEEVVTSGQFLIDSESRLQEAIEKYLRPQSGAMEGADARPASRPAAGIASELRGAPRTALERTATDEVFRAYLELAGALGEESGVKEPLAVDSLIRASETLADVCDGTARAQAARDFAASARAMGAGTRPEQRENFNALSAAAIAWLGHAPPSTAVADELFQVYCPMVPGSWLQRARAVANPFYAEEMKACGEEPKVIPLAPLPALEERR